MNKFAAGAESHSMKKQYGSKARRGLRFFFSTEFLHNQDQRHPSAPRPRAPGLPRGPHDAGAHPGGAPGPPPMSPQLCAGPPGRAPTGPPASRKKKKINATTYACSEAANTRTT